MINDDDFKKQTEEEQIRLLKREIENIERAKEKGHQYMDSIAYWEGLDQEAQQGLETIEKMYIPLKLHAEHMAKKLGEKQKELKNLKFMIEILTSKAYAWNRK
jgi:hypothetical protein